MLLNVCCAPCSLPIIEYLLKSESKENISLYFFGPNIYPQQEYEKRFKQVEKVASIYNLKLYSADYNHESWLEFIKSRLPQPPQNYPENSDRCRACFEFRLSQTALFAKENNFKKFATTLSISRHKDTDFINRLGDELAKRHNLEYITFPLDAHEAHRVGLELSRKNNLYRQKYCGCEFSFPV